LAGAGLADLPRCGVPRVPRTSILLALLAVALGASGSKADRDEWTSLFWPDGLPGPSGAIRVIETSRFALAMDTSTLAVPHFGILSPGPTYEDSAKPDDTRWRALPPAELSLGLRVGERVYRAVGAARWDGILGPRLVESGRWFQRADILGVRFADETGAVLGGDFRLETTAWPDRLGFALHARPPLEDFAEGERAFGRIGGGFGLTGSNHVDLGASPALDSPAFTLELWVYPPAQDEALGRSMAWLACRGANETSPGNFGLTYHGLMVDARLTLGPSAGERHTLPAPSSLRLVAESWNHVAVTYDGADLRLYVNGKLASSRRLDKPRVAGQGGLVVGRRGDGHGPRFRGAVDEVRFHSRALSPEEIASAHRDPAKVVGQPALSRGFTQEGVAQSKRRRLEWPSVSINLGFKPKDSTGWLSSTVSKVDAAGWHRAHLVVEPGREVATSSLPEVLAWDKDAKRDLPVVHDSANGWHRVDLDAVRGKGAANDVLERTRLRLRNPTGEPVTARLLFAKTAAGLRHAAPQAITGVTAVLRQPDGTPTGIPVQLSKNWHNRPEGGELAGVWFHGLVAVPLDAGAEVELELAMAYAHWGMLPAVSHAQLSLVGWGSNQRWDQAAFGAWGESFCFEPDQAQGRCMVLDVRPLMVTSMDNARWSWTHNVGGGDWLRLFDAQGGRVPPTGMRAAYLSQGPSFTHVVYSGRLGEAITHRTDVHLARSADLARASYRVRMDVTRRTDFSRLVLFQVGADTYNYSRDRKLAVGDAAGLLREWSATPGGDINRGSPIEMSVSTPWVSLHDAIRPKGASEAGAWANRGFVIREWKARLGGRECRPWLVERGSRSGDAAATSIDLVPPPDVRALEPGDFAEFLVEHVVIPQSASDYYGPDDSLRAALGSSSGWQLVHREAVIGVRQVEVARGRLLTIYPAVVVEANRNVAELRLVGGTGHVAVRIAGLTADPAELRLTLDGQPLDPAVNGRELWQVDLEPGGARWTLTVNLPASCKPRRLLLEPQKGTGR
jgi:hypothetical protein